MMLYVALAFISSALAAEMTPNTMPPKLQDMAGKAKQGHSGAPPHPATQHQFYQPQAENRDYQEQPTIFHESSTYDVPVFSAPWEASSASYPDSGTYFPPASAYGGNSLGFPTNGLVNTALAVVVALIALPIVIPIFTKIMGFFFVNVLGKLFYGVNSLIDRLIPDKEGDARGLDMDRIVELSTFALEAIGKFQEAYERHQ